MDIRSWAAGSLVIAVLIGATAGVAQNAKNSSPGDKSKPAAAMSRVERGSYLVTLMGCDDCHTPGTFYGAPDHGRRLSGSEIGWKGPWGVTYARNLTPHPDLGIGKWSEQEIVTALRTGMRPDGSVIQPPMPWPNYSQLTDDDAFAIAAFLKSLPAVDHKAPDRAAPGQQVSGPYMELPATPPAWDAPRTEPGKTGSKGESN